MGTVDRERGLVAEMPDGTRLVADAWHPSGAGRWPVLLQRLPYGRAVASSPVLPSPMQLARLGYAVVVQDVRGRGDSDGVFVPFANEAADGAATIEWAAGLPFSNGDVITYGYSYQGLAQLLAAARRPPQLRGVAAMMCGCEPYEGWTYLGGCLQWSFAATWACQLMAQEPGAVPSAPHFDALPSVTAVGTDAPSWWLDWLAHPTFDEYWRALTPDLAAIDVPVFTVLGYFDQFSAATARLVVATGAEVVCGPWAHMPWGTRAGDVELGEAAGPRTAIEAFLAFVARVASGGSAPRHRARWAPLGDARWRAAEAWPPPAQRRRWWATSTTGANSRHGDGRLSPAEAAAPLAEAVGPPAEAAAPLAEVLVSEPLVPVPGDLVPLEDASAAEDRRDVLCYTSDPLTAPLHIAGSPVATVSAAADSPTFDIVVSLVAVDAGGTARRLVTGALRARSSAVDAVRIELGPVAWVASPGERVRLEVSASRFPLFDRNPQSAAAVVPLVARDGYRVATIEVTSVSVELPVVD
ncbi:MAG TPA: CocE/NonD family hydrolase [Acidimicrobiales bacterium]|nr:CocE/NonD family hydrolase [Acidimicrobiales bacterium]